MQSRPVPAVDVHTHFVPENFAKEPPEGVSGWPSMQAGASCCQRSVMINGANYRTVTHQCWSAEQRIADMPAMGITRQVLSPMPELLSYWLPATAARVLLRDMNEQLARLVAEHPEHFYGLGAVPLQDVDMAIEELRHARSLGLSGVEIGSNVNGRAVGEPEFEPFFAAAQDLDMAIFVHSVKPRLKYAGPPVLGPVLGFPVESGAAAASVITSNLVVKYPRLRIAFSHGGGTLAIQMGRFQHCWNSLPALQEQMPTPPEEQMRKLYFDACVYSRAGVRLLVDVYGADRLLLGSDYPFARMEAEPVKAFERAEPDPALQQMVRYANAMRFLGIPE